MGSYLPIQPVQPGEPVSAGVVGRVDERLNQNIAYIRELLRANLAGQALILRDQPIQPTVLDRDAVYWSATTQSYGQALAAFTTDSSGKTVLAPSAYVRGLVYRRHQTDRADIIVRGLTVLAPSFNGGNQVGIYYLSPTQAGRLTSVPPALAIPVLAIDAYVGGLAPQAAVYVSPDWLPAASMHEHLSVPLYCQTAGTHNQPDSPDPHTIPSPDANLPGWLPANHAVFAGKAPADAVFGYNFSQHPELAGLWPPVPLGSFDLVWNRSVDKNDGGRVVPDTLYIADANGLWWMSDCYGDVPWPTAYDDEDPEECPEPPLDCPRDLCMTMTAYFNRLSVGVGGSNVLSLRPKTGSGVTIYCPGVPGTPRTTGHLEIDIDLGLEGGDDDDPSVFAFKVFEDDKLQRGPVMTGLKATGGNVILSSDHTDADGFKYGRVQLSVDSGSVFYLLQPQLFKLEGTTQEYPGDVPALGFKAGRETDLSGVFVIPAEAIPTDPQLKLVFILGGSEVGTVPALRLFYRRIPQPTGGGTLPFAVAESEITVGWSTTKVLASANHYYETESPLFDVAPGDKVIFRLLREVDGYSGTVYMADVLGRLQGS
jgi:hypothetical protein